MQLAGDAPHAGNLEAQARERIEARSRGERNLDNAQLRRGVLGRGAAQEKR